MRMLKQFTVNPLDMEKVVSPEPFECELIGLFENSNQVQELFMLRVQHSGTWVFDVDAQRWVEFKEFQKSGP